MDRPGGMIGRVRTYMYVALVLSLSMRCAAAADLLGLYVGGAFGQAHVRGAAQQVGIGNNEFVNTRSFDRTHSAFKVMIGVRPIPLVGAEVAYMDFGHVRDPVQPYLGIFESPSGNPAMHGESAFGVLYVPVPVIDFILKAGIARIQTELDGTPFYTTNCHPIVEGCGSFVLGSSPYRVARTSTGLALGAGAQHEFGHLAVRAEYERYSAVGAHPSQLSLGLTWSF